MPLQEYQAPYYHIQSSPQDYTIDATTFTLPTGRYFLFANISDVSIERLLYEMTIDIGTAFTAFVDYVDYNADTGRVHFEFGTTRTVTWTNTQLRDALGFTGNLSGASSYVAPNPPKYSWRPSMEPSYYDGYLYVDASSYASFLPRSSTILKRNDDGNVWYNDGDSTYEIRIEYDSLDITESITPTSGLSASIVDFQTFWNNSIGKGLPFYCVYDRVYISQYSVVFFYNDSVYGLFGYGVDFGSEEIGQLSKNLYRTQSDFNNLWSVSIPIYKHIP